MKNSLIISLRKISPALNAFEFAAFIQFPECVKCVKFDELVKNPRSSEPTLLGPLCVHAQRIFDGPYLISGSDVPALMGLADRIDLRDKEIGIISSIDDIEGLPLIDLPAAPANA